MRITTLDSVLTDLDDQPFKDGANDFTLRRVMKAALGNSVPSDGSVDVKHKEKCFDLMMAVKSANGELELDSEDVTIIKKRIGEMYPPWIVGQACKLIENKE